MKNIITQVALIGSKIVTNEAEAIKAARFELDWNGSSEADGQLECCVTEECDPESGDLTGRYQVVKTWGCRVNRDSYRDEVLGTFDTAGEAEVFAQAHNEAVLKTASECNWIELPFPVTSIYFGGCQSGKYPQSRLATVSVTWLDDQGEQHEIEETGFGSARFLADTHCHAALEDALEKLMEAMTQWSPEEVKD